MPKYPKYSQLGQDDWVLKSIKKGFFVEVGAHDGLTFSNTVRLEENGWKGLCVEPQPELFDKLSKCRQCDVSNLAVHGKSGEKVQFQCSDLYGGMVEHLSHADATNFPGPIIEVETITLDDLLTKHNCPQKIDYISVDTEGNEMEILNVFPFHKWDVERWTIEHNDHTRGNTKRSDELTELFTKNGYKSYIKQFDIWFYR
jgi:FkbM family methyltransferase